MRVVWLFVVLTMFSFNVIAALGGLLTQIRAPSPQDGDTFLATERHSAAVARLEAGVHFEAVSDLLGHSSIAITGDIFGHTSDDTAGGG
jgi:hypothetical protein